ncbi:mandelate racemase/muconate lactonizing enzyme family protein [Halobaculum sp. MBLA0147]|uniref:mandelate racemase/muconate lactonizing enzyme family protein n=1 Tax=Halobaculum sp. MBLA0147 TaxID=3079934 RepID=UPI003524F96F
MTDDSTGAPGDSRGASDDAPPSVDSTGRGAPTDWRLRRFALPLASPLGTAHGEIHERAGTLVGLLGASGETVGVGEATPLSGWTESEADCRGALAEATATEPRRGAVPDARTPAARFAVETARRDAVARRRGVPIAATLGRDGTGPTVEDAHARRVPVNATVGDADPAATVAAVEDALADGYETVKLKVGVRDVETDLTRVRRVVSAVAGDSETGSTASPSAPGPTLRVDANGAWDRTTATRALRALDGLVEYVEQPVPGSDLAGLAALRGVGAPVAADEALSTHDPWRVLAADAADVLVCKPAAIGGLARTLAVARAAAARGVDTVVTTTIDGVVARTAAVHLVAALPAVGETALSTVDETTPPDETLAVSGGDDETRRAHGLATASLLERDLETTDGRAIADPVAPVDGEIAVPAAPGLAGDRFDELVRE